MKKTLENSDEDHFRNVIELTWKFVTLPNPLIVCQPNSFNYHIHSLEYGYWDRLAKDSELIYTRPVVYRNYEGVVASKGWVANTSHSQYELRSKCLVS